MKERPILFDGQMVRAILDGRKTQTRRICKNEVYANGYMFDGHDFLCHNDYLPPSAMLMDVRRGRIEYTTSDLEGWATECPFGLPGYRLWVRETFCHKWDDSRGYLDEYWYRATSQNVEHVDGDYKSPWIPSIHMPRRASRILLEIVSVRVERLNDISEADAEAEGCAQAGIETGQVLETSAPVEIGSYAAAFCDLWESINGTGSWGDNPYVWAIEFRRIEQ